MGSNQKITGYLKITDNTSPIFSPGRRNSRLVKRRDEIVLEITKRDSKKVYYYDDPTARYFMKRPCDLKDLLPLDCNRKIEILCGQDECDLTGFGRPVNVNTPSSPKSDGDADGGNETISGGGGPPCLNPPCISVGCPNPPCDQEDCAEGENYNPETGECEPPDCLNSVGRSSCCFDQDQENCCYVTCYKVVSESGNERDCCTEPTIPFDPNNPCGGDLVCPECYPGKFKLCPVTEKYCLEGEDENGYLIFSLDNKSIQFDPNFGQFVPPNTEPDIECEADGTPCNACLTLPCGQPDEYLDGTNIGCAHGPLWVGLPQAPDPDGNPYSEDDERYDNVLDEIFSNSVGICNDPDGQCTRYRTFFYCICPPGPANNYKATYGSLQVPSCTVSWRPPSQEEPPALYPTLLPGSDSGWVSEFVWTSAGAVAGGPSSSCNCGV